MYSGSCSQMTKSVKNTANARYTLGPKCFTFNSDFFVNQCYRKMFICAEILSLHTASLSDPDSNFFQRLELSFRYNLWSTLIQML